MLSERSGWGYSTKRTSNNSSRGGNTGIVAVTTTWEFRLNDEIRVLGFSRVCALQDIEYQSCWIKQYTAGEAIATRSKQTEVFAI